MAGAVQLNDTEDLSILSVWVMPLESYIYMYMQGQKFYVIIMCVKEVDSLSAIRMRN